MSYKLSITDTLPLPDSTVQIPQLGFSACMSRTSLCEETCLNAIRAGYRHIDTSQDYDNEAEVGRAVRNCGVDRKDLFLTTKISAPRATTGETYNSLVESVKKIGGEDGYVDLILIQKPHHDYQKRKDMWLTLEYLLEKGKTKAIGVSNFSLDHIDEMSIYADIWPPHVNQLEVSSVPHPHS